MLHVVLAYRLDLIAFAVVCVGAMALADRWLRRSGRAAGGVHRGAWVAVAVVLAVGATMAEVSGGRTRDTLRQGMESFARTYAQELHRMGHARITWDTPPDDPLYLSMVDAQVGWLRVNPTVNDIYTFLARPGGAVAFVVDSETDYDNDGRFDGAREARTAIGEVYPEADAKMARALRGEFVFDDTPVTDRWGRWVNAYVPLFDPADPSGPPEAALGVDYDAAGWASMILLPRAARLTGATLVALIVTASGAAVTALRAEVARRAAAEGALRREEERFRHAAQCASDAVYEWDVNGRDLRWYGGAGGDMGFKQGGFPPSIDAWELTVHPDDRARVLAALERHVEEGAPYRQEYRVLAMDGTVRHWADRAVLVRDELGRPRTMIGVVTDFTDKRRAKTLEAEREGLKQAVVSMDRVLGVVGHELRTPLAGVRAITELLLTDAAMRAEQSQAFVASIHDEVVRMAGTVNDLLEAARLKSGTARWHWEAFDLAEVCRGAMDAVRPMLDPGAVELALSVDADGDGGGSGGGSGGGGGGSGGDRGAGATTMCGDGAAVRRLLLSLLDNARKHTARGHVRVSVRGRRDADGRAWRDVEVSDTGTGIAPEIVKRLGDAFVLNAGLVGDNHVSGAGLGLGICKGIAEAHGGFLFVRSEVGAGTTITVTLRADLPGPATGTVTREEPQDAEFKTQHAE